MYGEVWYPLVLWYLMRTGLPAPALRLNTMQEVLNVDSSFVAGEMGMVQQRMINNCLGRPHSCTDVKEALGKLRVGRMGSVQVFCQRC